MNALDAGKRVAKYALTAISHWGLPRVEPVIIKMMQHDTSTFTQGLAYYNGHLYESAGGKGTSTLRCLDPTSGQIRSVVPIAGDFAEGIAIYDNRLYQLSWKSEKARVFRLPDLELVEELRYDGEGWGLASGPAAMVMSNGTGALRFVDGAFRTARQMRVTLNRLPTRRLNDLEWVGDAIYANVLFRSEIWEISAHSGRVIRTIDCCSLAARAARRDVEHTLNGIAYNPDRGTFFVTGKCWPYLFEVQVPTNGASIG